MDFRPDESQEMLIETIKRLANDRMRAVYRDADEEGVLPSDVIQAGWEIGLLPTAIPEAYDGFGEYSVVTNVLALEELAWGDLASTMAMMLPNLVALPIMLAGTEEQKAAWLPPFCGEEMPAVSAALTEPTIQFDPRTLRTSAVRNGDQYQLNGQKTMVPLADEAETILVYAQEEEQTQAFLVPANCEGLTIGKREKWMGVKGLPLYSVTLENVVVSAKVKVGEDAGIDFNKLLNHSQVALGAAAVGVARASYEYALTYAKERHQFGEPIAHRQSIAFMLAEMLIDIESARLLVWEAAWLLDQGQDVTAETTVMKQYIDDMVVKVTDCGLQTLGGHGYIREYPVELWLRNARGFATFDGLLMA